MTSQPGAGGDAVEWARRALRADTLGVYAGAGPSMAAWIVRWSDTVAAAVRQETVCRDTKTSGPECVDACRITNKAVRSALTHRDEKEGG